MMENNVFFGNRVGSIELPYISVGKVRPLPDGPFPCEDDLGIDDYVKVSNLIYPATIIPVSQMIIIRWAMMPE
jgi:hypothetical protein